MKYLNDISHLTDESLENTLVLLNGALHSNSLEGIVVDNSNEATVLTFKKNVSSQIKLIHLFDSSDQEIVIDYNFESNSNVKIVEAFKSFDVSNLSISFNYQLDRNANVNICTIESFNKEADIVFDRVADIKRDASLDISLALFNDCNMSNKYTYNLNEENASAISNIVAISSKDTSQQIDIKIDHHAKHTTGEIINHGVATDKSSLVMNGIGKIQRGMSKSNAQQSNRGIILDKNARLEANPLLLIDEFDVQAGHGASIGKISDEGLFYLMSRGLSKTEAEKLIINGFVSPILALYNDSLIEEEFKRIINDKL